VGDAEIGEVAGNVPRGPEGESGMQLHPVGGGTASNGSHGLDLPYLRPGGAITDPTRYNEAEWRG